MIETKAVTKRYGSLLALDQISLSIPSGEIVGLLGPNGAGKTTLLRMLTGYFEPTAGEITIDGIDVVADPLTAQRRIGYLPESTPLYPEMLVQEYLLMMAELRGLPAGEERLRLLSEAVWATGLEDQLTQPIGTLSTGFRQRVGIAQAILQKPKVLILDEPTSGLDPSQVLQVRELIRALAKRSTVLFSTHILSEVEQVCERAVIMLGGRIQRDAKLAELQQAQQVWVAVAEATALDQPVTARLRDLAGVKAVTPEGRRGEYLTFAVETDGDTDVCRGVYRLAQRQGWELGELRPVIRTLESVFREVVAQPATPGASAEVSP